MIETLASFSLHTIVSVDDAGVPTLEGTNARVMTTTLFTAATIGCQAVCQTVRDAPVPTMIALGVVSTETGEIPDKDAPLVLSAGAASLTLYPDGRVYLKGEDIAIDAALGLNLLAARIDLN